MFFNNKVVFLESLNTEKEVTLGRLKSIQDTFCSKDPSYYKLLVYANVEKNSSLFCVIV